MAFTNCALGRLGLGSGKDCVGELLGFWWDGGWLRPPAVEESPPPGSGVERWRVVAPVAVNWWAHHFGFVARLGRENAGVDPQP